MKCAITTNNKAIVSSKGQVVIPKLLREQLGIHAGHELIFLIHNNAIEIRPVKRSIDMFFSRCKRTREKPMSLKAMDKAIMDAVSKEEEK